MTGITLTPLVPMRTRPAETSEMCSQLLYGECVEILDMQEGWLHVCNLTDRYTGWADRKMIYLLNEQEEKTLSRAQFKPVQIPVCTCRMGGEAPILLPGGSRIPFIDGAAWLPAGQTGTIDEAAVNEQPPTPERIVGLARQYLNAPYLWGGKSVMGIDCSGLVQVVFAMCGTTLPRDASMQVEHGTTVDFLSEAASGDLAFFENAEGRIIHVGILLDASRIIHASGRVKIDKIDAQGIISTQTGEYSHKLRIIKRAGSEERGAGSE